MTKEEFEKEYKCAEYRYAEMKQYKKLHQQAKTSTSIGRGLTKL